MSRYFVIAIAVLAVAYAAACSTPQPLYHGFPDQPTLERQDAAVLQQSASGNRLDPMTLAQDNQRYSHDGNAYDRLEEGYYQWGHQLYTMGYRDEFYVRDLAPKAFGHDMMDTYDHAIAQGFEDAKAGK
jgi:hypothetical protein